MRGNISILSCIQDDDERWLLEVSSKLSHTPLRHLRHQDPVREPPRRCPSAAPESVTPYTANHPHSRRRSGECPHDPCLRVAFTSTPHPLPPAPLPTNVPSSSTKRPCVSLARPARKVPPRRLRRRDHPPAIALTRARYASSCPCALPAALPAPAHALHFRSPPSISRNLRRAGAPHPTVRALESAALALANPGGEIFGARPRRHCAAPHPRIVPALASRPLSVAAAYCRP
ncbi:hypothetical protein B0H14DRAFT_1404309 [Mycena olivaceomarginata]|nr:hypothetical protein B0H14DRAFT_1404309 [Mycena olivaceomarginata]